MIYIKSSVLIIKISPPHLFQAIQLIMMITYQNFFFQFSDIKKNWLLKKRSNRKENLVEFKLEK
jgi:hypothetical protein